MREVEESQGLVIPPWLYIPPYYMSKGLFTLAPPT